MAGISGIIKLLHSKHGNTFPITTTDAVYSKENGERLADSIDVISSKIGNLEELPTTEKGSVVGAVTELNSQIADGILKIDLLWTNTSPTSEFASQKISLDLSKYKLVIIRFDLGITDSSSTYYGSHNYGLFMKSSSKAFSSSMNYSGLSDNNIVYREINTIDDSGIQFGNGKASTVNGGYINSTMIPTEIYGIK